MFVILSLLTISLTPARNYGNVGGESYSWRSNATESAIDFTKNDLLLGVQDTFFWFLVPLFGLISLGACVAVNYAVNILIHALGGLRALIASRKGYIKHEDRPYVIAADCPPPDDCPLTRHFATSFLLVALTPRQRIVNTAILLFLVSTIIPYQFAYVVACLVQLVTCVHAVRVSRETVSDTFPLH
jgi:hypothetical protein